MQSQDFIFSLLVLISLSTRAQEFVPKDKYFHLYNKKLNTKPLENKGYIKSYEANKKYQKQLSSKEEKEILLDIGLKEYIQDKDVLDRKIMLHRLKKYVPKRLISYYPEIPPKVLVEAQMKLK